MRLRRSHGDVELLRDLLVRVTQCQEPQDLALAVGERVLFGAPALVRFRLDEPGAELGVHVAPPAGHFPDRRDQLGVGGLLEDIAARAGLERLAHVARVMLHREDEYLRLRELVKDLWNDFDPALVRHHHVHQDNVGLRGSRLEDGIAGAPGLADCFQVVLSVDEHRQACSYDRMVVHNQDSDPHRTGTSAAIVVPPSRPDSTSSRPPSRASRSRIPTNPKPSSGSWAGSNPRPSSSTTALTAPFFRARRMLTRRALPCLTTFVSDS